MISQLASWVREANQIVILTGAGVSAESGLATFRGATQDDAEAALWEKFDPYQLASMDGFIENPERVWQWYQWRRRQVSEAKPNMAHQVIAWLEQQFPVTLITQNVDGLHQLSGSQNVCALHGEIMQNTCTNSACKFKAAVSDIRAELSKCPLCETGYLRPGVVWFGESLDPDVLTRAELATYQCDLFFSVGTSSQVYPAAGFAQLAKSRGARIVEINLEETELSPSVDLLLTQSAATTFEQLQPELIDSV